MTTTESPSSAKAKTGKPLAEMVGKTAEETSKEGAIQLEHPPIE
jgi:hypothetical protein